MHFYFIVNIPLEILLQSLGKKRWPVVREQSRSVLHLHPSDINLIEGQLQRFFHIAGCHVSGQPPGENVAGEVIKDGVKLVPSPADDLELGEVCLPHLVDAFGRFPEVVSGGYHLESRAGNQVKAVENAVYARFRDEVLLVISDVPG